MVRVVRSRGLSRRVERSAVEPGWVDNSGIVNYSLIIIMALSNKYKGHSLGEFEQLTMVAIARLGPQAYGAPIRQELEDVAHRTVSISTVYVTLVRLEKKGFLESHRSDPELVRGGKAKRYFTLTAEGTRALREAREAANRMWQGVESSPDPGPTSP